MVANSKPNKSLPNEYKLVIFIVFIFTLKCYPFFVCYWYFEKYQDREIETKKL